MSVVPSIGAVVKGEAAFNNERSVAPSMAQSTTSGYRKDIALKRQDLRRSIAEVKLLKKLTDIAQTELRVVEANYLDLKDTLEAKRRSAATNTLLLDKLSLTNRMLIKTLNSLELKADMVDGFVSLASKHLKAPTTTAAAPAASSSSSESKDPKAQTQPIAPSKELSNELMTNKNNDTYLQNMRLKESLLNITRDHFRAVDATFRMSAGMEDLKMALRTAQVKNTQLLKDLAGMRNEEVESSEEKKNKSSEEEDKVDRRRIYPILIHSLTLSLYSNATSYCIANFYSPPPPRTHPTNTTQASVRSFIRTHLTYTTLVLTTITLLL